MWTLPRPGPRTRLFSIGYGAGVLVWLSVEDQTLLPVVLVGSGLWLLLLAHWLAGYAGGRALPWRVWLPGLALAGAAAGAGAVVTITLLMFFKTAWHAHPVPDYPVPLLLDMLARLPAWTAAGLLAGLAAGLLRLAWAAPP
ncbi:MAG: hypothetical protein MUE40_11570 [Anaerolineae bacterium]|jgi:hypothetical protein|nr:hypothetical protein [Anaerolineae bacterium]